MEKLILIAVITLIILGAVFVLFRTFTAKKGVKNAKSGYFGKQKVNNPDELLNE